MHATVEHNVLAADRDEDATSTDILASSKRDNLNSHRSALLSWFVVGVGLTVDPRRGVGREGMKEDKEKKKGFF